MGQATLDLPDPTPLAEQLTGIEAGPLSPEALASADDLLSQLAGDDIDRLLAEAEAERVAAAPPIAPPIPAPDFSPDSPAVPVSSDSVEMPMATDVESTAPPASSDLSPVLPASQAAVAAAADAPAHVATGESEATTEAAIDAILAPVIDAAVNAAVNAADAATGLSAGTPAAELSATTPDVETHEPAVPSPDQKVLDDAAAHVAAIMDPPAADLHLAAPSAVADAAERQALSEPLIIPPAHHPSAGVSFLVRILEWVNWPMTLVSDDVREMIGKVAIITTFNAAAVIVYVMVFRRPHH